MKFCHLIRNLVRYRFNFECKWFNELNTYGIAIILGNREYIIPYDNEDKLKELWDEIKTYWLN